MSGYRGLDAENREGQERALRLMEALSGVDEDLLERSGRKGRTTARPGSIWQNGKAVAAALCLAVVGAASWGGYQLAHLADGSSGGSEASYVAIESGREVAEDAAEDLWPVQGEEGGMEEKQMAAETVRDAPAGGSDDGTVDDMGGAISDAQNGENAAVQEAAGGVAEEEAGRQPGSDMGCAALQARKLTEAEARAEAVLGSYVPTALPAGYAFQEARQSQEAEEANLTLCWSRGMDSIMLYLVKTTDSPETVDVDRKETYDNHLYEVPYGETVPEEYRESFNDPVFAAEDLSLEVIEDRMKSYFDAGDTDTPRGNFSVLYPDGVLVRFSGRGTAEEIWEMFCSMGE